MRTGNKLLDATKDRHIFYIIILPLFNSKIVESPGLAWISSVLKFVIMLGSHSNHVNDELLHMAP
jgi:hypothetical protein